MDYEISPNNIQLKSSFEVSKEDFESKLSAIRAQHPDSLVWNRSMDSLKREWAVHNAFYALGLIRRQSADTDLNWPQPWYVRLGYALAGRIAWRVIR